MDKEEDFSVKFPEKNKKATLIDEVEGLNSRIDYQGTALNSYDQERGKWLLSDEAGQFLINYNMSELKAVPGRVIVKVNMQEKNSHTFSSGQTIHLERGPNNLNQRETQPVQGEVIDSEYIPKGSIILFQHNGCQPTYQIFNYKPLSGSDLASHIRYFSIPDTACYLFRSPYGYQWFPLKGFEAALRIYKPYNGIIQEIDPELIKNRLYITSGHLRGKAVMTVKASDYQIVFQGINGQEENIIRCRHWENPEDDIEGRDEIMLIDDQLTSEIWKAEMLVGLTPRDAKTILELSNTKDGIAKVGYGG